MRLILLVSCISMEVSESDNYFMCMKSFCCIVPPSEPLYPFYTTTSHDTSSFSILLEWTRPQSDGGLGITNYTITLRVAYSVHTYVETSNKLHLTLLYNLIYAVEIVAANCAGYGRFNYLPSVHEGKRLEHSVKLIGMFSLQLIVVYLIFQKLTCLIRGSHLFLPM